MQVGLIVSYALFQPGVCLIVAEPWCVVHNLMQANIKTVGVEHGINSVKYKQHQLAFLSDWATIGVDQTGIIPVL